MSSLVFSNKLCCFNAFTDLLTTVGDSASDVSNSFSKLNLVSERKFGVLSSVDTKSFSNKDLDREEDFLGNVPTIFMSALGLSFVFFLLVNVAHFLLL